MPGSRRTAGAARKPTRTWDRRTLRSELEVLRSPQSHHCPTSWSKRHSHPNSQANSNPNFKPQVTKPKTQSPSSPAVSLVAPQAGPKTHPQPNSKPGFKPQFTKPKSQSPPSPAVSPVPRKLVLRDIRNPVPNQVLTHRLQNETPKLRILKPPQSHHCTAYEASKETHTKQSAVSPLPCELVQKQFHTGIINPQIKERPSARSLTTAPQAGPPGWTRCCCCRCRRT